MKNAVVNTVKDALVIGHKILTWLGFENQDSISMVAPFTEQQSSLVNVAAAGMPLQANQSLGDPLAGHPKSGPPPPRPNFSLIIDATLYADPYPLSVARVLAELGYNRPVSLRLAMSPYLTSSVQAWAAGATKLIESAFALIPIVLRSVIVLPEKDVNVACWSAQ